MHMTCTPFACVMKQSRYEERLFDELFRPRLDASGEFAMRAARCLDIPLSFSASHCFSFLTSALFLGMDCEYRWNVGRNRTSGER